MANEIGRDLAKVFEGAYTYYSNNQAYSEETFSVFKNYANQKMEFNSTIMTRVANGEFFIVKVFYRVNKDYVPTHVIIDKTLGSQNVKEIYMVDFKEMTLEYNFVTDEEEKKIDISLPPKFYISAPCSCTSFLYYLTKKFDTNGTNYFTIFNSSNIWKFENEPIQQRILVEAPTNSVSEIKLNDTTLACSQFQVFCEGDEYQTRPLNIYMSKHYSIPYRITGGKNLKIEIDFLKNLEQDKLDLL